MFLVEPLRLEAILCRHKLCPLRSGPLEVVASRVQDTGLEVEENLQGLQGCRVFAGLLAECLQIRRHTSITMKEHEGLLAGCLQTAWHTSSK